MSGNGQLLFGMELKFTLFPDNHFNQNNYSSPYSDLKLFVGFVNAAFTV